MGKLKNGIDAFTRFRQTIMWTMLVRQRWWLAGLAITATWAFTISISNAVTIRDLVDKAIVERTAPLDAYVGHLVFLAVGAFVIGFAQRQLVSRIGYQLEFDLRTWLYERLQGADPRQLDGLASGQLVTRALTDLLMLELLIAVIPIVVLALTLLGALALLMLAINLPLGLLALAVLPINFVLVMRIRRRLWALSWASLDRRAQVTTRFDEAVRGIRVVKAFGREEFERARVGEAAVRAFAVVLNRVRLVASYDVLLKAIPIVANALLLILAGRLIADRQFTLGELLIFLAFTQVFSSLAQSFDEIIGAWLLAKSGAGRIFDLISMAEPARRGGDTPASGPAHLEVDGVGLSLAGRVVLEDVSFDVRAGELVVVSGAPGSGTNALAGIVSALADPTAGDVRLDGHDISTLDPFELRRAVRVVDEDPFLFGRTLRENLSIGTRGELSDAELLDSLRLAGAESLVDELPEGLDSTLGERGLTLSGGQRQRVALARAIARPPRVLVLSDALSAVHPSLEAEIVLRVREAFPDMAILVLTARPQLGALADRHLQLPDRPLPPQAATAAQPLLDLRDRPVDPELIKAFLQLPEDRDVPDVSDDDVATDEGAPTVAGLLRPFRGRVIAAFVLLGAFTLIGLVPEGLISIAVDDFGDRVHDRADKVAVAIAGVAIVVGIVTYFLRILVARISEGVMYLLRVRTFRRLSKLGIDFYDREFPGKVAARVVFDLDQISGFVEQGVYQVAISFTLLVAAFGIMFVWNTTVALAVAVFVPVLLVVTAIQAPLAYRAFLAVRHRLGDVVTRLTEDVSGRVVIDSFAARQEAGAAFANSAHTLRQARRWATSLSNAYAEIVQLCIALATATLLSRAGNLALDNVISIGSVIALQLYLAKALAPIPLLFSVVQRYLAARASFTTLAEPFEAPIRPERRDDERPAPQLAGHLELRDVSFTYPGTVRRVLDHVDVTIEPGEVVAIVGPTGAGKSSLAKLVARIYDPDEGSVLVDAHDLTTVELDGYRHQLGVVPQEAFCFRGDVVENLSYGRPGAPVEDLEAAVERVGGTETLASLPNGLRTLVDEDGRNLSTAQRQVIALARALVTDPRLLILDEATANLEGAGEERVLEAIRDLGCTVLFVTHRLHVASRADRILVVDTGRIVEDGTHDDLVGAGGRYATLWEHGPEVDEVVAT